MLVGGELKYLVSLPVHLHAYRPHSSSPTVHILVERRRPWKSCDSKGLDWGPHSFLAANACQDAVLGVGSHCFRPYPEVHLLVVGESVEFL
jgi:hypothetical protein